jgi:hypothetical protein
MVWMRWCRTDLELKRRRASDGIANDNRKKAFWKLWRLFGADARCGRHFALADQQPGQQSEQARPCHRAQAIKAGAIDRILPLSAVPEALFAAFMQCTR